jgi:colanic acid/amylovoran biosynthesis glycosyltransferase
MTVGYFINVYPRPSHSFIRREIAALEAQGVNVKRYALRADGSAIDDADQIERTRTRYVLNNKPQLLVAVLMTLLQQPIRLFAALALTMRIAKHSDRGRLRHLAYLCEACVLTRWLITDNVSHIHAHFGTNSTAIAMLCHILGGPTYSFTAHGPEEFDKAHLLALSEKIKRAEFVVAVCDFGRSQLMRHCPHEQWKKIKVVRCGLDAELLQSRFLDVPEAARLVSVGRLSEQKGQLMLLDAATRLVAEGCKFTLTLIGDGEMRREVQALIEQNGLQNTVELLGWQTSAQVRDAIVASRAMVIPSFAEGLPVVLMEAMALRRPVISTYIAGIPELVLDAVNGILVPAGSVDSLVDAMRAVLTSPTALLSRMGREGHSRVSRCHDAMVEAGKLASLFRAATKKSVIKRRAVAVVPTTKEFAVAGGE